VRQAVLLGVLAVVALLAEACGGSANKPHTKDAFIARAAQVCRAGEALTAKLPDPKTRRQEIRLISKGLAANNQEISELRRLRPPDAVRSKWTRYLELENKANNDAATALTQLRAGHIASFRSSLSAGYDLDGRAGDLVWALGIHACAPD
jgi:hypothetical protein